MRIYIFGLLYPSRAVQTPLIESENGGFKRSWRHMTGHLMGTAGLL